MAVGCESGVWFYRLEDGRPTRLCSGHSGPVYCLAPSKDGRWLATGSSDQTVRLWTLAGCDSPPTLGAEFGRLPEGRASSRPSRLSASPRPWACKRATCPRNSPSTGCRHRGGLLRPLRVALAQHADRDSSSAARPGRRKARPSRRRSRSARPGARPPPSRSSWARTGSGSSGCPAATTTPRSPATRSSSAGTSTNPRSLSPGRPITSRSSRSRSSCASPRGASPTSWIRSSRRPTCHGRWASRSRHPSRPSIGTPCSSRHCRRSPARPPRSSGRNNPPYSPPRSRPNPTRR